MIQIELPTPILYLVYAAIVIVCFWIVWHFIQRSNAAMHTLTAAALKLYVFASAKNGGISIESRLGILEAGKVDIPKLAERTEVERLKEVLVNYRRDQERLDNLVTELVGALASRGQVTLTATTGDQIKAGEDANRVNVGAGASVQQVTAGKEGTQQIEIAPGEIVKVEGVEKKDVGEQ